MSAKPTLEEEAKRFKSEVFALHKQSGVAVRVEGKSDKEFWTKLLEQTVPQYKFEVFTFSNYPKEKTEGKINVLEYRQFADKNLLLCVDSDYDYILQNADYQQNKYILKTYIHSVENYDCIAAANQNEAIKDFFEKYSDIIFEKLVSNFWEIKHNSNSFSTKEPTKKLTFQPTKNLDYDLEVLSDRLAKESTDFSKNTDFQSFKQELYDLGLTKKTAFYFVRGHSLEEILNFLVKKYEKYEENEIHKKYETNVDVALLSDNFFYQKIQKDASAAFKK